eukprot:8482190-Pyramimonas_sp.AAC.1
MCSGVFSCVKLASRCGISSWKALRIKKCFAAVCKQETKEFLQSKGTVLALHQDGSKLWLCVRFTGCNDKLERASGLLSFVDLRRWQDQWAENMKSATVQAVVNACSDGSNEPDAHVVAKVLKSFEVYNADAAADEQLAGSLLRGQSYNGLNYCKALLPNVKVLHRDKTHAARRLCSRGWKADAYLASVIRVKPYNI